VEGSGQGLISGNVQAFFLGGVGGRKENNIRKTIRTASIPVGI